jgi:hypothetical protein
MKRRCDVLLLVLSLLTGSLYAANPYADEARTLYVNDDAPGDPGPGNPNISDPNEDGSADHPFDSIQEAIDAAWAWPPCSSVWPTRPDDTVIVAPGHYLSSDPWQYEELDFQGKGIQLLSSAPTDFSVVEKTVLCGVVLFRGYERPGCRLQGFKIQNHICGGILGNGTFAAISHCIISGNGPCGATVLKDVRGRISNCLIVDNTTFHGCEIGPVVSGCPQLFNCTIANNISGVSVVFDNRTVNDVPIMVHNCILYGNQGEQLTAQWSPWWGAAGTPWIDHCLIQGWSARAAALPTTWTANLDGDPCFVQPGVWAAEPTVYQRNTGYIPLYPVGTRFIEGDYHLKSEGYRWSKRPVHGSNWDSDSVTSCAIDAGDPTDTLGDELERGPDDPEGFWGVNHAIDVGAYGGTSQASLAPTENALLGPGAFGFAPPVRPLGVGGVDLRDYLPLAVGNSWSRTTATESIQSVIVTKCLEYDGHEMYRLADTSPLGGRTLACVYLDYVLYTIQHPLSETEQPVLGDPNEAKYPQILTVGSTLEAPADLFAPQTGPRRPALVLRGTLAEVLAGTRFEPGQFVGMKYPPMTAAITVSPVEPLDLGDVIAIREKLADGTAGEPLALFARGVGPLLLNGEPVTEAQIGCMTLARDLAEPSAFGPAGP